MATTTAKHVALRHRLTSVDIFRRTCYLRLTFIPNFVGINFYEQLKMGCSFRTERGFCGILSPQEEISFLILFYFFMKLFWVLHRRTLKTQWYGTYRHQFLWNFLRHGDVLLEVFIKCNIGRGKTINSLAGLEIDGDGSSR